ncbi:hypothetical protein GCM10027051_09900 [Niabella terrae]
MPVLYKWFNIDPKRKKVCHEIIEVFAIAVRPAGRGYSPCPATAFEEKVA